MTSVEYQDLKQLFELYKSNHPNSRFIFTNLDREQVLELEQKFLRGELLASLDDPEAPPHNTR
jgi:FMN-dependent NADH-azoreductase